MINKIINIGKVLENNEFTTDNCRKLLEQLESPQDLESFSNELAQWILENELPEQLNIYNHFGQPPVTIYNNGIFVIDIYFWMHADTSLHSHAFSGAFKVLFGKSLHEEYEIKTKNKYTHDIHLNEIKRVKSEILKPKDIREIKSGKDLNHRVVHLSSPTVTLCIRTVKDFTIPQWHYFDNGLSILKRELHESIFKKLFFADYLANFSSDNSNTFTKSFISSLDLSESMNLFEQLTVDTMGLSENYQQTLFEIMMDTLQNNTWFKLYEEACDKEIQQAPLDSAEEEKLIIHLNNYSFDEKEATKLFNAL